jgi:hypothetical protein
VSVIEATIGFIKGSIAGSIKGSIKEGNHRLYKSAYLEAMSRLFGSQA